MATKKQTQAAQRRAEHIARLPASVQAALKGAHIDEQGQQILTDLVLESAIGVRCRYSVPDYEPICPGIDATERDLYAHEPRFLNQSSCSYRLLHVLTHPNATDEQIWRLVGTQRSLLPLAVLCPGAGQATMLSVAVECGGMSAKAARLMTHRKDWHRPELEPVLRIAMGKTYISDALGVSIPLSGGYLGTWQDWAADWYASHHAEGPCGHLGRDALHYALTMRAQRLESEGYIALSGVLAQLTGGEP